MTGTSPGNAVLEAVDLSVAIVGTTITVVEPTSFSLAPGEILGLVGESGSGKTTLGLALLAHHRRGLRLSGGRVLIRGQDLLRIPPDQLPARRRGLIRYVPQNPGTALNPGLRIGTQLAECFATPPANGNDHLLALLEDVKLPPTPALLRAYPHQLSGGQQQRVAIAMAFAERPPVIVMDEPTTGLDVTTQAHVLQTVRQLCARHAVAALYVSHDLAVVATLAHRVAVMYAGRVVELGPTGRVLHQPAHPYTRALIEAVPDLDRRTAVAGIAGQAPEPARRPAGCAFAPRCALALDACRAEPPALAAIDTDHLVACLRPTSGRSAPAPPSSSPVPGASALPALEVRNISARHGATVVLHGASFSVSPQTCVALVGESGSGKTTLGQIIAGLHHDWDGDILLGGAPLAHRSAQRSAAQRCHIQYIFQNPYSSFNPRRRIGESIAMAVRAFESPSASDLRRRVAEALDMVALPREAASRYPHQLSGGQRQRAAIARALITGPKLLICDEITSALDVSVQAVIVRLLARLQQEHGLSLLFITHNLALVRSIAQHVLVMHGGRVIESEPVDQVLDAPQQSQTRRLLADAPRFSAAPVTLGVGDG
ncbi:ABC transporter ATP-binding protein [Acidiphilium sp. AL]|uniref:ABC transporter ATP-binding protein n=1 Tax=Acidiphilium sp. AL TaxID=2871704 RepID=UPI0021CB111D|nr:ABC transporter ATP-binding protein [Acidiphilium sp. AL]MCU4161279.1 ABC transporter ATP-binding protein [Acidiphilium sp. AL]